PRGCEESARIGVEHQKKEVAVLRRGDSDACEQPVVRLLRSRVLFLICGFESFSLDLGTARRERRECAVDFVVKVLTDGMQPRPQILVSKGTLRNRDLP